MTKWPYWPNYQMSILTRWPYWLDDHIGQMIRWQNDKMTILTRWPDDQIIRWSYDQMTTWLDDHSLIISKTNRKSPSLLRSLWGLINGYGLPIPDRMMIYDDLTILMYRNIIKNNSYPLPHKVWPLHPKLARHLPYQVEWWYMMIWPY